MTNEERHRTMQFILEQQAQFAASIQRLEEERIRDGSRLTRLERSYERLEESFQRLVHLEEIVDSRLDRLESITVVLETKSGGFEESLRSLNRLVEIAELRLTRLAAI